MYVYNVTVHVEPSVENDWLKWMKDNHLPNMMNTGQFIQARLFKIINDQDHGGISYATQYYCASKSQYEEYIEKHASQLRQHAIDRFGSSILAFRTQLEEITTIG